MTTGPSTPGRSPWPWLPRLDGAVLRTLYAHELRMLGRDRRTILIAVVAPLLILPIVIGMMRYVEQSAARRLETTTFRYAVTGSQAEAARELVDEAVAVPADAGENGRVGAAEFEEVETAAPDSLLAADAIQLVVEGMSPAEWRAFREGEEAELVAMPGTAGDSAVAAAARARATDPLESAEVPVVRVRSRGSSERSMAASQRLEERLQVVRERRQAETLRTLGLPVAPDELVPVTVTNVATPQREGGALLGQFLTPLLVLLMLTGGSIVAVDTLAGEKERGTLENLLTTGARRAEIVASKQLAVITVGLAIALINLLNLLLYLTVGLIDVPDTLADVRLGAVDLLVLLALFLPLVVLASSALLLVSGYVKSYKEYQIYQVPVVMIFLAPALAAVLPGIDLRSLIAIVPVANVSVAVSEILVGERDWPFLALAVLSTTAAAAYGARLTARVLSTERLITAAELDRADLEGGPALFPRRVLRWFATMWALLLLVSVWVPPTLDLRAQVLINIVGLFFGATVLMIRRYRLPVREALSLRMPHPLVWPLVLIAAPAALLSGIGLAELLDYVVPVPPEVIESFGQYVFSDQMPLWQAVLFIAVVPGILEELAFRGLLLYGLRRKLSPFRTALAVGVVFGLFHVALFRIGPTAYLGFLLAGVVLLTGSIFPAMLWHALNNAIALLGPELGVWDLSTAPPTWAMVAGAVTLVGVFLLLARLKKQF